MSCTIDENTFFNQSLDTLSHYGVMGMKWGVRNEETLRKYNGAKASFSTKHKAKKDAKEFARAKMFWGEGAGTRRKQINATVEQRSKDLPGYKEHFDKNLAKQDMAKHVKKAKKERKVKDTKKTVSKTARGVVHIVAKTGVPVAASAVIAYKAYDVAKKTGADKLIKEQASKTIRDAKNTKAWRDMVKNATK